MAVIKIVPMPGAKGDKGDEGATGAQGLQGPIGAAGPAGADAIWYYNGAWQSNASYAVGDVVTYQGQLYYTKATTTAGTLPTDTTKFDLIAAKGEQGEPGTPGSLLNYWNGTGTPQDPAEDGLLILKGIVTGIGDNLLVSASNKILINANNGEFLNDATIPSNQIATIGDIQEVDTLTNGLVVTGQIDDVTINPAGSMALNVGPGYTALMDVVAHSAVFNGDVQITNLSGTRNTTIETPTTINNDLTVNGYSKTEGAVADSLKVNGITRDTAGLLYVGASDKVWLTANNGEFLHNPNIASNQIATIGDLPTGATGSFVSGDGKTITVTNGIITSIV